MKIFIGFIRLTLDIGLDLLILYFAIKCFQLGQFTNGLLLLILLELRYLRFIVRERFKK